MNNACTHGREFVAMASDVRKPPFPGSSGNGALCHGEGCPATLDTLDHPVYAREGPARARAAYIA